MSPNLWLHLTFNKPGNVCMTYQYGARARVCVCVCARNHCYCGKAVSITCVFVTLGIQHAMLKSGVAGKQS